MNFRMTQDPLDSSATQGPTAGSPGIARGVESAARARAPAPKGKGVVMLIVGAAVLGALIWDFTRESGASRAVRQTVTNPSTPVAPTDPDDPDAGSGTGANPSPGMATGAGTTSDQPLLLRIKTAGGARVGMSPGDASGLIGSAPPEQREALRRGALDALLEPADLGSHSARRAFEAAARFVVEAGPGCRSTVSKLTLLAFQALENDVSAPAAILFLSRLPDRGGNLAIDSLDEVIKSRTRPLHVRIAAARARPAEGIKDSLSDLLEDPTEHPALVEALRR